MFHKELAGKTKVARIPSHLVVEVSRGKSRKSDNGAGSDDEDDEADEEERTATIGNVIVKRCPRAPYFQDPEGNVPPRIEESEGRGILYPAAPQRKKRFAAAELEKLRQMVRQQNQQLLYSKLYSDTIGIEASMLTKQQLDRFETEKARISKLSDFELEKDPSNIDWEMIQSAGFAPRTANELESEWKLFCDPNYVRVRWTPEEDEELRKAALAQKEHHWERIAAQMQNKRLPVQYLARYTTQIKPKETHDTRETTGRSYNVKLTGRPRASQRLIGFHAALEEDEPLEGEVNKAGLKWTPEEDEMLREAVKRFGDKNWTSVANELGGLRSGQQCLHRWQKTLKPTIRHGRWDQNEDNLLAMAIKAYGAKNWRLIQKHVPGRTDVQCRERWVNVLDPSVKSTEGWTGEEDALLLEMVAKFPKGKWSLVAKAHNEAQLEKFLAKKQNTDSAPPDVPPADNALETPPPPPPPSKSPPVRTDNQCWRRWKSLDRHPKRVFDPNNPNDIRASTVAKRLAKRARNTPDWMKNTTSDEEADDVLSVVRVAPSTPSLLVSSSRSPTPRSPAIPIANTAASSPQARPTPPPLRGTTRRRGTSMGNLLQIASPLVPLTIVIPRSVILENASQSNGLQHVPIQSSEQTPPRFRRFRLVMPDLAPPASAPAAPAAPTETGPIPSAHQEQHSPMPSAEQSLPTLKRFRLVMPDPAPAPSEPPAIAEATSLPSAHQEPHSSVQSADQTPPRLKRPFRFISPNLPPSMPAPSTLLSPTAAGYTATAPSAAIVLDDSGELEPPAPKRPKLTLKIKTEH